MATGLTLPLVYVARHGETEWSRAGKHTGRTDIPLTPTGEQAARRLGDRLAPIAFDAVFSSPLIRAHRTAQIAGYATATVDPDLMEWHYGDVEGLTSAEYRERNQGWSLFRDGGPGGESVADVSGRADRVVARLRAVGGTTLVFSSGHLSRVLAARWLGLDAVWAKALALDTAALCVLGYEHTLDRPVIRLWNDTSHLRPGPTS